MLTDENSDELGRLARHPKPPKQHGLHSSDCDSFSHKTSYQSKSTRIMPGRQTMLLLARRCSPSFRSSHINREQADNYPTSQEFTGMTVTLVWDTGGRKPPYQLGWEHGDVMLIDIHDITCQLNNRGDTLTVHKMGENDLMKKLTQWYKVQ